MKHILVIDDAATVRMFYREVLTGAGFAVEEAENGIEGLEKALSERFDMLVVDVNMPKMNGLAFLRELRARRDVYQAPAVVATTEVRDEDRAEAYRCGANFYVRKPTRPDELMRVAALLSGDDR